MLLILLAIPVVCAAPRTDIRMDLRPVSDPLGSGLSVTANFTVLFTESSYYTETSPGTPGESTGMEPAVQKSLENAKVYFYIRNNSENAELTDYIQMEGGGGPPYAASDGIEAQMSDGTTKTVYYGFYEIPVDSSYNNTCTIIRAEFRAESDDPDPNIGNARAEQEICFGSPSMPSMLTFLITDMLSLANPALCAPILLLIVFAGGAFYFRGSSMVHLLDFYHPKLPRLHEVKFKYGGYGWHGSYGDATKAAVADLTKLKNMKGLKETERKELKKMLDLIKKDKTGLAGILASGRLAGLSIDQLKEMQKDKKSTHEIYMLIRDAIVRMRPEDLDDVSKSILLGKMKVFLEGNAVTALGKANIRAQRGIHDVVVKGVIGGLQKGNLMSVLLAPMKYTAKAGGKMGKAFNEKVLDRVVAEDSKLFRQINEPLFHFLGRLSAGGYIFKPVFNLYFLALPNIGHWKNRMRNNELARHLIGLGKKDREDAVGTLSPETKRRTVPKIIEAIDRENTTFIITGVIDKALKEILSDKKLSDKLTEKEKRMLVTLDALKGSDLMNTRYLDERVNVLSEVMKKLGAMESDKGHMALMRDLVTLINKGENNGLNFGKSSEYLAVAEKVFGRRTAEYGYLSERIAKVSERAEEMKDRGALAQIIVSWKLNNDLDNITRTYAENKDKNKYMFKTIITDPLRTAFNGTISRAEGSARYMIAETFYSLAKLSKEKISYTPSLANAFGMAYLEQLYNNYGFMPADKAKIKAMLRNADEIALKYLPPKSEEKAMARLSEATLDRMADNLSQAMKLANDIVKGMNVTVTADGRTRTVRAFDLGGISDELSGMARKSKAELARNGILLDRISEELRGIAERDGNYLIFFNARAMRQEIEGNRRLSKEDKAFMLDQFILGEGFKRVFAENMRGYLFGQPQRQNPNTYLEGKHWAYISERDRDPYTVATHFIPTSRGFGDKGEAEEVGKMVSFWNTMFRSHKGVFKRGEGTRESMEREFFTTLSAEGSGNDDRNFIKFSNRTTTIQGRNILEFAKRQIHTADYVLQKLGDKGLEGVIDEMRNVAKDRKKEARFSSEFASIGSDPEDVKTLLGKKGLTKAERERLASYAVNYYLSVSENKADNGLVTFGDVKKDKDFIFMTGELGDYVPLRTNLKNMTEGIRKIITNEGREDSLINEGIKSDLHFVKTIVPKAGTEKAINMRVSYIGDHGHIYRSINELAESYRNIRDPEVRAELGKVSDPSKSDNDSKAALERIIELGKAGKATKEEVAIAAFRYGQRTGNYEQLFSADNVSMGSYADVEARRREKLGSIAGLSAWEVPFAKLLSAKEKTIDAFVNMHENVVYRNALRLGNQDIFGMESFENRVMKESFAVLDEYRALNTMLARMEQGNTDFALVQRFNSAKDAEDYVRGRMKELRNTYDAFEWFMTRDVHPIYGGSYPHMREGLISASFNAGLSTFKPQWIDQMLESYGAQNYDNYPVLGGMMKMSARYMVNLNAKLQEPFVLMMRAEDKMTRGLPNPYEIKYEYNNDIGRNMAELGVPDRSIFGRRFTEGPIRGPGDQLMTSDRMDIGYTMSSVISNLMYAATLPFSIPLALLETRKAYRATYGADEKTGLLRYTSPLTEPIERPFDKYVINKAVEWGNKVRGAASAIVPIEGSAIADSEEKWIAKRPPSHFGWHSGEFGTPGDLPGREHLFWGSGKRQIEPGQMWKMYNLHTLDVKEDTRSPQDLEGLDYASLSIRKRASTLVDDYFKRTQEADWFSPSRHPVGIMSSPLFMYNWISSTTGRMAGDAMDTVKEEGIRKAAAKAAKAAAGAPVAGFVSFVSNSANMVAVSAGGTNFLLKCPTCGSYVRRDAPYCPVCRRSSAAP